jgi:tetratricopeptide (TPR) repeat protein
MQFAPPAGQMKRVLFYALFIARIALAQDAAGSFADLSTRAAAARDANDAKSAIALYKQALQLNPNWQAGWWGAGSLEYDSGQYADGVRSLGRLVALSPAAGPAWALLGLCEYETGAYGPAFEHIQRSLALGVGDQQQMIGVLKFHEALLLTKTGAFDAAVRKYSEFVPGNVSDQQVLLGLGLAQLRQAATPPEIPAPQRDLFLAAGSALAASLVQDKARSKTAYNDLLARFPDNANVHYAYGYFEFGANPEQAIKEWERALSIDPSNSASHAMLAWAFWLLDEKEKALIHAQAAVAKDPNSTVAHIVLGRSLVLEGRVNAGIEHLELAARLEPVNLEVHLALATAYSEAGRKLDSRRERQLCAKMQAEAGSVTQP